MQESELRENEVPVAVRNYQTARGWKQARVTQAEQAIIQKALRRENSAIFAQSMEDAKHMLAQSGIQDAVTSRNVITVAEFLAERRIVHISKIFEEYLTAKVTREREEFTKAETATEDLA
jgi:uncharacterized protein (DUF362 family)